MSSRKVGTRKTSNPKVQKKTSSRSANLKPVVANSLQIDKPKWFKEREDIILSSAGGTKKSSKSRKSKSRASLKDSVSVLKTARSVARSGKKSKSDLDKDSEYHYGSDFNDEDYEGESDDFEASSSASDEFEPETDIVGDMFNDELFGGLQRPPTPLPFWLRGDVPLMAVPESSDDLILTAEMALKASGIYEVLRRFSHIARVSPFKFEDFLAALQADEFSNLLVEIHMMLIKALIREEEQQQTQFGPQDLKDSINSVLYFVDAMTWPEVLRSYFQSDKAFQEPLKIIESCNYPFTSVENRLEVMGFMVDQFLLSTPVRDYLACEGNVPYEDHCRVCHRLGDLLCCETCPAVYHLECISPRIDGLPPDDWKCSVCTNHAKVKGVIDCITDEEKAGLLIRHDHLGFDRIGRKYWFVCRRIFVEDEKGEAWYYSTKAQLQELMEVLDEAEYESDLFSNLTSLRPEIERQMEITESLTNQKRGDKKSYIDADTELIEKLREERMGKLEKEEEAKKNIEEQLKGEVVFDQQLGGEMEVVEEVVASEENPDQPAETAKSSKHPVPPVAVSRRLQLVLGGILYRLGSENSFRSYKNQYSENPLSLNKFQHQEEKDKRRHLSHKFSLTPASEFKWSGSQFGTQSALIHTFRNTLLHMQQSFLTAFCHYNWPMLRRNWVALISQAKDPTGFAKPLALFSLVVKLAAYNPVWTDQLGHTRLQRQTVHDREERKKQEKKEERDKKLEEEINRTYTVHYTIPLKHQVHKQRGEEYRLHGRWGWQWLSAARNYRRVDPSKLGHKGDPQKLVVSIDTAQGPRFLAVETRLYKLILDHKAGKPVKEASNSQVLDMLSKKEMKPVGYDIDAPKVINVSESLASAVRHVYPKIAAKGKMDSLLEIRMKLYEQEKQEKEEKEVKKEEEKIKEEKEMEEKRAVLKEVVYKKLNDLKDEIGDLEDIIRRHPCYVQSCRDGDTTECYSPSCTRLHIVQEEIEDQEEMLQRIDAGEDITQSASRKITGPVVRIKAEVKEEKVDCIDEGFVDIEGAAEVKKEETEEPADTREYAPTAQPYSLKKPAIPVAKKILDIPFCKYSTKSGKSTIFAIPAWEQRKVARTYGQFSPSGFNPNAKGNQLSWPYPCSRLMFKTTWYYRTAHAKTIGAAALQLRLFWACLRWDDMGVKPPISDLKQVKTTEHELITTEYLTMRTSGHYKERMEYLKRTLIIPLDKEKKKSKEVDLTPARLGLRKRKKVEHVETSEPSFTEEWVDETNMELWEIRLFYDKHIAKRHQSEMSSLNRVKQITAIKSLDPSLAQAMRAKTEESIRQQRMAMKLGTGTMARSIPTTGPPKANPVQVVSGGNRAPSILSRPGVVKTATSTSEPMPIQIRHAQGSNKFEISGLKPGQRVMVKGDVMELQSTDANGKITGVVTQIRFEGLSKIPNPIFVSVGGNAQAPPIQKTPLQTPRAVLKPTNATPVVRPVPQAIRTATPLNVGSVMTVNGGSTVGTPTAAKQKTVIERIQEGSLQLAVINGQNVLVEKKSDGGEVAAQPNGNQEVETQHKPPYVILSNVQPGGKASLTYKDVKPSDLPSHIQTHIQAQAKYYLSLFHANAAKGQPPPARVIIPIPGYTPGTAPLVTSIPASQIAVNPAAVTGQMPVRAPAKVNAGTMQFKRAISHFQPRKTSKGESQSDSVDVVGDMSPPSKSPEVTPVNDEYIKKTIQQALRGKNVNPVDQQRLRSLLDNGDGDVSQYAEGEISRVKKGRKRKASEDWGDEDFTPKYPHKTAATPIRLGPDPRATPGRVPVPRNELTSEPAGLDREERERMRGIKAAQNMEVKRIRVVMAKLNTVLHANTAVLKKDISRRKADAEKRMIAEVKAEVQEKLLEQRRANPESPIKVDQRRQRKTSGKTVEEEVITPPKKTKRERKDSEKKKKTEESEEEPTKDKLFCVCRKPYDATQFYVGCDVCSNWYHGECVGITKKMSKKMTEYICDECKQQNDAEKVYCICRKPYDESQFYICCDKCQEWFHGRCIGILATESSSIDEYDCPSCDPETVLNRANFKRLTALDYETLKKLVKQVIAHKSSEPFRTPVDRREAPNYYNVIKNPMDLQTMSTKLRDHKYRHLHEFVSDMMLIFDNCRFFNPRGSKYTKLADNVEKYFIPLLQQTRQALLS